MSVRVVVGFGARVVVHEATSAMLNAQRRERMKKIIDGRVGIMRAEGGEVWWSERAFVVKGLT